MCAQVLCAIATLLVLALAFAAGLIYLMYKQNPNLFTMANIMKMLGLILFLATIATAAPATVKELTDEFGKIVSFINMIYFLKMKIG